MNIFSFAPVVWTVSPGFFCYGRNSKLWDMVKDREAWHTAVNGVAKGRT